MRNENIMQGIDLRIRKVAKVATIVFLGAYFSGCSPECTNTILTEKKSPDGKYVVTIFERDCGATTAKNKQISIRRTGENFESSTQPSFFVAEEVENLDVDWKDSATLVVSNWASKRVFKQMRENRGLRIDYGAPVD